MSVETFVVILAIVFLVGMLPTWPHSRDWGYRPSGVLTVLLVVFLVWAIAGGRPLFRRTVGGDLRAAGQDIKAIGQDAVASVDRAVR